MTPVPDELVALRQAAASRDKAAVALLVAAEQIGRAHV